MTFHTAPVNQGQIVTVSYGWNGGDVLRRTHDASDQTETIRILRGAWDKVEEESSQAAELDAWDPWNDEAPTWLDALLDKAPTMSRHQLAALDD